MHYTQIEIAKILKKLQEKGFSLISKNFKHN